MACGSTFSWFLLWDSNTSGRFPSLSCNIRLDTMELGESGQMKQALFIIVLSIALSGCATTRPWSTTEKAMLVASCLAAAADIHTTMADGEINEINPIIGPHPSNERFVGFMVTSQLLTIVLAHYCEDFRTWMLGIKTGINAGFAFSNTRTK